MRIIVTTGTFRSSSHRITLCSHTLPRSLPILLSVISLSHNALTTDAECGAARSKTSCSLTNNFNIPKLNETDNNVAVRISLRNNTFRGDVGAKTRNRNNLVIIPHANFTQTHNVNNRMFVPRFILSNVMSLLAETFWEK